MENVAAWRVQVEVLKDGSIQYRVVADESIHSAAMLLDADKIIHFKYRCHGAHPYLGVSPIASGAPSLAAIMQVDLATKSIYKNIAVPSMLLVTDKPLGIEQAKRLKDSWQASFNAENMGKTAILDNGIKPLFLGKDIPTALDLQLNEIAKLNVLEVARLLGIPPQLLAESSDVNNSTSSELSRSFVKFGLGPLAYRISSTLSHSLLSPRKLSQGYRIELDLTSNMIGQGEERSTYLSQMVNSGVMSLNEARALSNLAAVENGGEIRVPINTLNLESWVDWTPGGPTAFGEKE